MKNLKLEFKDQISLFDSAGDSPRTAAVKKIQEMFPEFSDSDIDKAIRFSGFPLYEDAKYRNTFFERIKYYHKVIRWKEKYPKTYVYRIALMKGDTSTFKNSNRERKKRGVLALKGIIKDQIIKEVKKKVNVALKLNFDPVPQNEKLCTTISL